MPSRIQTASILGLEAHLIEVEADISPGLPNFLIVGLPDTAIQEARERIRSAVKNSRLPFPRTRVVVNLAPAHVKKVGPGFDVPIALAILLADGTLEPSSASQSHLYIGELALDGTIRPIQGMVSVALLARELGIQELFVPTDNAAEAALINGVKIWKVDSLHELYEALRGRLSLVEQPHRALLPETSTSSAYDFSSIRGQEQARRALEIAAAGGHNLLMQGPPGSGKTLLARAFQTILPTMTEHEMLETTRIHSVAGMLPAQRVVTTRPFRSPHHSSSMISLVGGGGIPRPGEVSLAHHGVLFLDELPEFSRSTLECLRQPLEDGSISISRAQSCVRYPAQFMLLGAMNPCPCGYRSDKERSCTCSQIQVERYRQRLSGPLLDRIDLYLEVPRVETEALTRLPSGEASESIRIRVQAARECQIRRFASSRIVTNAQATSDAVTKLFQVSSSANALLQRAVSQFHLSARAYFRLLKVSRTIADLAIFNTIEPVHVAEALQYRISANY